VKISKIDWDHEKERIAFLSVERVSPVAVGKRCSQANLWKRNHAAGTLYMYANLEHSESRIGILHGPTDIHPDCMCIYFRI